MFRTPLLALVATALLRVCNKQEAPPSPTVTGAAPAMIPEHGGALAVSAGLTAEVTAQPNGRIVAYVTDPMHQPLAGGTVQLTLRKPDGQAQPVAVRYDPTLHAYVGVAAGLPPGPYPVEVSVQTAPDAPAVHFATAPVTVTTASPPMPRHGGRVQIVGDHAVELVAGPTGDMAMYWMDLDGTPIPTGEVTAPSVTVTVAGRPETVPTRPVGDHFVAHAAVAPHAELAVAVPNVVVRGESYPVVAFSGAVMVPVVQTVVVEPVVAPVYVAPVAPAVVVTAPSIEVGVGLGVGMGVGYGGGVVVPRGRRGEHDDDDDDHGEHEHHGRGRGWGWGRGHGGGRGHGRGDD